MFTLAMSITTIFISSMLFTSYIFIKQRQWDIEDSEPEPVIYPFLDIKIGVLCPKCKAISRNEIPLNMPPTGLSSPMACHLFHNCNVKNIPHLHVFCNSCKMRWLMSPADQEVIGEQK